MSESDPRSEDTRSDSTFEPLKTTTCPKEHYLRSKHTSSTLPMDSESDAQSSSPAPSSVLSSTGGADVASILHFLAEQNARHAEERQIQEEDRRKHETAMLKLQLDMLKLQADTDRSRSEEADRQRKRQEEQQCAQLKAYEEEQKVLREKKEAEDRRQREETNRRYSSARCRK